MFATTVSRIAAEAEVPEQLTHYVQAVSGRKAMPVGEYVAYALDRHAVLIAYPGGGSNQDTPPPADLPGPVVADASLGRALEELALPRSSVSALAPFLPAQAPAEAHKAARSDSHWQLRLPPPTPAETLRPMLGRPRRAL